MQKQFNIRPLSPHLSIYKAQQSSRRSILHRVTGSALGFFLRVGFFGYDIRSDRRSFLGCNSSSALWSFIVSRSIPVGYGLGGCIFFSFVYHFSNGLRHLYWDARRSKNR